MAAKKHLKLAVFTSCFLNSYKKKDNWELDLNLQPSPSKHLDKYPGTPSLTLLQGAGLASSSEGLSGILES